MNSTVSMKGVLKARVYRAEQAPLAWRVRNWLSTAFLIGTFYALLGKAFSRITGIPTLTAELSARAYINGRWVNYGVLSRRVVTSAGVAKLVDGLDGSDEIDDFDFHGVGTGTTAEDAGDTALVTESTTILTADSTRATGTPSQPSANIFRSTGTVSFDGSGAITEHGIFDQAATGGGVLLDRSVFSAINVASGDSIQFQYSLTLNSGG